MKYNSLIFCFVMVSCLHAGTESKFSFNIITALVLDVDAGDISCIDITGNAVLKISPEGLTNLQLSNLEFLESKGDNLRKEFKTLKSISLIKMPNGGYSIVDQEGEVEISDDSFITGSKEIDLIIDSIILFHSRNLTLNVDNITDDIEFYPERELFIKKVDRVNLEVYGRGCPGSC